MACPYTTSWSSKWYKPSHSHALPIVLPEAKSWKTTLVDENLATQLRSLMSLLMDNILHDKFGTCKTNSRERVFINEMVPFPVTRVYVPFVIWTFILPAHGTYVVNEVDDPIM